MALIDNEKLYENIEKKLELIKAAKEQPVIMKPFIKDFAYRFCWSSNALEGNTLSLDETICLIDYDEVRSGHTYTEYQEAKNLYKAIKKEMLPSTFPESTLLTNPFLLFYIPFVTFFGVFYLHTGSFQFIPYFVGSRPVFFLFGFSTDRHYHVEYFTQYFMVFSYGFPFCF